MFLCQLAVSGTSAWRSTTRKRCARMRMILSLAIHKLAVKRWYEFSANVVGRLWSGVIASADYVCLWAIILMVITHDMHYHVSRIALTLLTYLSHTQIKLCVLALTSDANHFGGIVVLWLADSTSNQASGFNPEHAR